MSQSTFLSEALFSQNEISETGINFFLQSNETLSQYKPRLPPEYLNISTITKVT